MDCSQAAREYSCVDLLSRFILVMARANISTTFGVTFKETHDDQAHGFLPDPAAK